MNQRREQILGGILVAMVLYFAGEYAWQQNVQAPLITLDERYSEIVEKIEKGTQTFKRTKALPGQIRAWEKQALPGDNETARSLYRNWLLTLIRDAKLQNSRVDAGTPSSRRGYRILSVNASARGTLRQITDTLFAFENADLLHKIVSLRLVPQSSTGRFELAMNIEAVMMPKAQRKALKPGTTRRTVSAERRAYDIIAQDNIFGIAIDHRDPMQMTKLTGVTSRNGVMQAWITEQIEDRVHRLSEGAAFDTIALSGRVVKVEAEMIVIESGGQHLTMEIGQSFADAAIEAVESNQG